MARKSALVFGGVATLALLASLGCRRASERAGIAKLVGLNGTATRDFAAEPEHWQPAPIDAVFAVGDALRTGHEASARVELLRGGTLKVGGDTKLRFLIGTGNNRGQRVAIDTGEAELEAGQEGVTFDTPFGLVVLEPGATAHVSRDGQRTRFEVLVGAAVFASDEAPLRIERGQSFVVDVGGAIIENAPRPSPDSAPPVASASPIVSTPAPIASAAVLAVPSSDKAHADLSAETLPAGAPDVTLDAGESAVIHDARGSTAVRIRTGGACSGDALVEIVERTQRYARAPLATSAVQATTVLLSPGTHPYRVKCLDGDTPGREPAAHGTLRVSRDSGAARIPRTAPQNTIDADGRDYRVLYQSILPAVTFVWPRAPSARNFTLRIEPARGAPISMAAGEPNQSLKSGALAEGSYLFWFMADADAGRQSPKTKLRIDFDNAAPAAEIQEPIDGRAAGADPIQVSGLALEGANVSVDGTNLPLDRQQRFRGQVPRDGRTALAIRIAHPSLGIHYYVRRP